jgi:hypothetical protein
MSEIIHPRSPRETMAGWAHLPRYIDKIRLHLAGKLPPDYQENLGKGFDGLWLQAAGLTHEQMVEQVRRSITDGEICDWVRRTARKSASDQATHLEAMLNYPGPDDTAMRERLRLRKEQSGLADRDDIQRFVDYIDADEGRT